MAGQLLSGWRLSTGTRRSPPATAYRTALSLSQAFQVFLTLQVECFILRRDDILFQLNSGCNTKLCCTTIFSSHRSNLVSTVSRNRPVSANGENEEFSKFKCNRWDSVTLFCLHYIFVATEINDFDVFPLFSLRFESHIHFVARACYTPRALVSALSSDKKRIFFNTCVLCCSSVFYRLASASKWLTFAL